MLKSYRDKALQVYRNHGARGLARKTKSFVGIRVRRAQRAASHKPVTLEEKALQEEFGFVSNEIFQVTSADIEASRAATAATQVGPVKTATWFVPYFDHIAYGGIQTIFRFIEKMSKEGVKVTIVIFDRPTLDVEAMRADIANYFPDLKDYKITVFSDDKIASIKALPASDIAVCTIWLSAYLLLRFNKTKRKYYFIQDYEPLFYVAGSTYALAESTYRFGFTGVVNTPGLLAAINQRHGLEGVSFIPAVNRELYYPDPQRHNDRVRIFFYARPGNPRNAFNLGLVTIRHLLETYGSKIEIITAGANWDEAEYGLRGQITNRGLINSIQEVAQLYRSCDIGFSFMLNKHPSYQMLEYAASGMATVMNENEDHHWLYKDKINCLLSEPSPAAMAEKVGQLIDDPKLRQKLVENAQKELGYTWEQQTGMIWNYIANAG